MSLLALGLILASALTHASWNLLAKRAAGGLPFTWLFSALSTAFLTPLALGLLALERPALGAPELVFVLGSALIHTGYFLLLASGYRLGDLSLVYPLARGTGPLLASAAAVAFFGERPGPIAIAGARAIGLGVLGFAGDPRRLRGGVDGRAVWCALLVGVLIATYTIWDKQAVSGSNLSPLVYFWGMIAGMSLVLLPPALGRRAEIGYEWQYHRREAIGIAVLSALSYILALSALAISPVSHVAPAREIGILFGALMGSRFLAESDAPRRLVFAGAMVLGVVALAIG
ncbi:MAG: EamA family transporter [Chloroflexi bacterium]|nr:EamA family transporter [Chloroflexota bacterium]